MQLTDIFAKDINRSIDGVIKADDASQLDTEVDEYVMTAEVEGAIQSFLDEYTDYRDANGVWISGFFGSGKSHLLKMLALLLGDEPTLRFPRALVTQAFAAKSQDAMLQAKLAQAARIPATSLLFNIDLKVSDSDKRKAGVMLGVFYRVFNEARGYFGAHGHVAQFERDLEVQGLYGRFKEAYASLTGKPWEDGRRLTLTQGAVIDKAFSEAAGRQESGILKGYQDSYAPSIEDFADDVAAWLAAQPDPAHRLNFFVDEVGQFIGGHPQHMLNLQTIAEALKTKCEGRAWVVVTSQEDMASIIGDQTARQGNDFTKIQARFKTQLKLTSRNVEEVIRKRLLEKNAPGTKAVETVYDTQHANFKTLFSFDGNSRTYRNYVDAEAFIDTYPFVSYQVSLFQDAMVGISRHNLLTGKSTSVGERSLLEVFQDVVKQIATGSVGDLATFDLMFEGIRARVKSQAQAQILSAERDLDDDVAKRVLKALFLVKYVDHFKATTRNLTVLLTDRFDLDLPALTKSVEHALAELEQKTYVQRNGLEYEYLTDEEQEIEQEIKSVDVDTAAVIDRMQRFVFDDVLKLAKIRYAKTGQVFPFNRMVDDQLVGRGGNELSIRLITPGYADNLDQIKARSMGRDDLYVVVEPDVRLLGDLRLVLQTEKYTRVQAGAHLTPSRQSILQVKASLNDDRAKEVRDRFAAAVARATLIVNGSAVQASSTNALARVTDGFQSLVSRTYTDLALLQGKSYNERNVGQFANPDPGLVDLDVTALRPAAADVLTTIQMRANRNEVTTVKNLVDRYAIKSYGWDLYATLSAIALLVGNGSISATADGQTLTRDTVAAHLIDTRKQAFTMVAPTKSYDAANVARLKSFCHDFFYESTPPTDPVELAKHVRDSLAAKVKEVRAIETGSRYPFIDQLNAPLAQLEAAARLTSDELLGGFPGGDELLDARENTLRPIEDFINGAQSKIYDDAAAFLAANEANLAFVPHGTATAVRERLDDPNVFRGNKANLLKRDCDDLRKVVDDAVADERSAAVQQVEAMRTTLRGSARYAEATDTAREATESIIDGVAARLGRTSLIAQIREIGREFADEDYGRIIDQLEASAAKTVLDSVPGPGGGRTVTLPPELPKSVAIRTLAVPGLRGAVLETEEQVDAYLADYRTLLLDTIHDGKRITL
jgi:energy-coupling factor transporter ATP-binding protein EcfA2